MITIITDQAGLTRKRQLKGTTQDLTLKYISLFRHREDSFVCQTPVMKNLNVITIKVRITVHFYKRKQEESLYLCRKVILTLHRSQDPLNWLLTVPELFQFDLCVMHFTPMDMYLYLTYFALNSPFARNRMLPFQNWFQNTLRIGKDESPFPYEHCKVTLMPPRVWPRHGIVETWPEKESPVKSVFISGQVL